MKDRPRNRVAFVLAHSLRAFKRDPGGILGGAEVQVRLLAGELSKTMPVAVVGFESGTLDDLPNANIHPCPVAAAPRDGDSKIAYAMRFVPRLFKALHLANADVYVKRCSSYEAVIIFLYCRMFRRKFVYHWASDQDFDGRNILSLTRIHSLFKWTRKRADFQICQTVTQHQMLTARERTRSIILPNVLDERLLWTESKGDAVLWVGNIRPEWKQPQVFLDLAEKLPDRTFLMAGQLRGSKEFQNQFRQRANALGNVELAGFVNRPELPKIYSRARCLVNTSTVEGFPNTFLEAAACGVPTISLNIDPNGMLGNGAGLYLAGMVEKLPAAVETMFDDEWWNRYRENCRRIADQHSVAAASRRYTKILQELSPEVS
jgi:glycosyltransferase involved in cell wall biosynthesis